MNELKRLDEFVSHLNLIGSGDKVLVAVSGGKDSMFLLTYLLNKKVELGVAHCNFGLRGEESNGDEALVNTFCEQNKVTFHTKTFETEKIAQSKGISIQMAARDLRYAWFNALCDEHAYTKIATAHHKTDNAETILLNLTRGTGLLGLEGIKPINNNVIRPLLCLSRSEIDSCAAQWEVPFREDSSNESDKYSRNRIRHHVLPQLQKINPAIEDTLQNNAKIMSEVSGFISVYLRQIERDILWESNDKSSLSVDKLMQYPEPKFILYSILSKFNFSSTVVDELFNSLNGISGKQFFSSSHRLIIDRGTLLIEEISDSNFISASVEMDTTEVELENGWGRFLFEKGQFSLSDKGNEAVFDLGQIKFPITLRPWQQGDKIQPLGMTGHKKVSDVLIDKKIPINQKDHTYVMESDGELMWVVGLVVSEKFKITPKTIEMYKVNFLKK